jgi:hypothetical protein
MLWPVISVAKTAQSDAPKITFCRQNERFDGDFAQVPSEL